MWGTNLELFLCSKGFFIVCFETEIHYNEILDGGPWFWGNSGLSMRKWYPEFNPLTTTAMTTPVWVRLPNLPLQFWYHESFVTIGDSLGKFIKEDTNRLSKGLATFARICVELDLSKGLSDKINITWCMNFFWEQPLDYENTAFRCRSRQQPGHLQ